MSRFLGPTLRFPARASAPASPALGDAFYNTTTNDFEAWDGTAWRALDATGTGGTEGTPTVNPTYKVASAELTGATAIGQNRWMTLWHPSTLAKTVKILTITISLKAGWTAGVGIHRLAFISAENATPGGTLLTPQQTNRANPASGLTVRALPAAPTIVGAPMDSYTRPLVAASGMGNDSQINLYDVDSDIEEPITLRTGVAEGLMIYQDITTALTGAPIVSVSVKYTEA